VAAQQTLLLTVCHFLFFALWADVAVAACAHRQDLAASRLQSPESRTADVPSTSAVRESPNAPATDNPLPRDAHRRLTRAKALYRKAVDDGTDARAEALRLLTHLAQEYPDHATVRAYLGSVWLLEAKHTWLMWRKYRFGIEGLRLLDSAVTQAPQDLEVRFIRGVTTYHLPAAARRDEQAAADLQWVTARAADAVDKGQFDPTLAATAFYYHGMCRATRSDPVGAQTAWHTVSKFAPTSAAAELAAQRLQTMATGDGAKE
jgi:hypothetical protein